MSLEKFEHDCPGCRPALIDTETGEVLPDEHPLSQAAFAIFNQMTLPEKQAWHRLTCLNARDPEAVAVMRNFTQRMRAIKTHD